MTSVLVPVVALRHVLDFALGLFWRTMRQTLGRGVRMIVGQRVGFIGWRVQVRALCVAALLLAACSGGADEVGAGGTEAGDTTTETGADSGTERAVDPVLSLPSASPAPAASTPEAYQAELTALDDRLAEAMRALGKRRSIVGLTEAIAELRATVDAEHATLGGLEPPETVADAHAELDVALSDLSTALTSLETDAQSRMVCAGESALRQLGNSDGAAAVREAAARLAESDPAQTYTVGEFVPEDGEQRNRRGRNGELRRGRRGGLGELKITGSPNSDSLLKLRIKKRGIRNVYVRRNTTVTIDGLPDGRYEVYLAQGKDWNGDTNRFTRSCSFSKFDDKLNFRTTSTQYTIYQLELLESFFGNATTTDLDPEDFPE